MVYEVFTNILGKGVTIKKDTLYLLSWNQIIIEV